MTETIEGLLKDNRLDWLMLTPEFSCARGRLKNMAHKLSEKETLDDRDIEYLNGIKNHIGNIRPHIEKILVNGEEQDVIFSTII